MTDFLKVEQTGYIVTLTMNHPARRNVLTGNSAAQEFQEVCSRLTADNNIRVAILTGAGPAFSAGGDLHDMQKYLGNDISLARIRQDYRDGIQSLAMALFNLEIPIIAAVNGPAIGAGFDLACFCDLRIASTNAKFAESFLKVGLIPGDGGSWILPRIVGYAKAAEMTFTGDMLDANGALEAGIVSRVVEPSQLLPASFALAERIAKHSGETLRMAKRLLRAGQTQELATVLDMAAGFQATAHKGPDHANAVAAFVGKNSHRINLPSTEN